MLMEKLMKLMSIEISDTYGFENENSPTDLPTRKIKYSTVNKTDSTYLYFPGENELPVELENFIQILQQVISENDATH